MIAQDQTATLPLSATDLLSLQESFLSSSPIEWEECLAGLLPCAMPDPTPIQTSTLPMGSRALKNMMLTSTGLAASMALFAHGEFARTEPIRLGQILLPVSTQAVDAGLAVAMPGFHALSASVECGAVNICGDDIPAATIAVDDDAGRPLALIDLANGVLADSRPMSDWEQKVTDDFFWSQFS